MKTNSQPKLVSFNRLMTLAIVMITLLNVSDSFAQRKSYNRTNRRDIYLGFGGSFGVRSQKVQASNYSEINNTPIVQEGGSGTIVTGNSIARLKLEAGFYFSSANMLHTNDLVELAALVNIYPLQLISQGNKTIEPYLIAGVTKSKQKFYGFYHMDESQVVNYSVTIEPFVGNLVSTQATFGTGLEWHLRDDHSFVHIFAEAKYSKSLSAKSTELLNNTTLDGQLMVNLGIVVGRHY
jgi:hypothetical protein